MYKVENEYNGAKMRHSLFQHATAAGITRSKLYVVINDLKNAKQYIATTDFKHSTNGLRLTVSGKEYVEKILHNDDPIIMSKLWSALKESWETFVIVFLKLELELKDG